MSDNCVWTHRDFDTDSLVLKRGKETVTLPWWAYEHIRDDHEKAIRHLLEKCEILCNLLSRACSLLTRACSLLTQCNIPSEINELANDVITDAKLFGVGTTE